MCHQEERVEHSPWLPCGRPGQRADGEVHVVTTTVDDKGFFGVDGVPWHGPVREPEGGHRRRSGLVTPSRQFELRQPPGQYPSVLPPKKLLSGSDVESLLQVAKSGADGTR